VRRNKSQEWIEIVRRNKSPDWNQIVRSEEELLV
jgi:hypothetical protein